MSDALQEAIELEQAGHIERAVMLYRSILADYRDPRAAVNLGTIHYHRKEYGTAAGYYRRAIECAPDYAQAHFNLGASLDELGSTERAMEAYRQCIRVCPTFADAHYNLALLLEKQNQPRKAIKHWRRYIQLDPMGPWASYARSAIRKTLKADCLQIVWRKAA